MAQSAECQEYEQEKDINNLDDCFEDKKKEVEEAETIRLGFWTSLLLLCVCGCCLAACAVVSAAKFVFNKVDKNNDGTIS